MTARVRRTVLVVDDSLTVRMDLRELLEPTGVSAVEARDLASAREALAGGGIDLVILDLQLPDGDGLDLLAELQGGVLPPPPVLLLSTRDQLGDRMRGLEGGAVAYLGKPYGRAEMLERVRSQLSGPAGSGRSRPARLLVIEDSLTFREALCAALREAGYEVEAAETGTDGLRMAGERPPDLVLIDAVLPDLDGRVVIQRLRLDPALAHTPCVMLTGTLDPNEDSATLDAGADAFLLKELGLEVVLARVGSLLRYRTTPETAPSPLAEVRTILVVDDSPTFLGEVDEVLRAQCYATQLARSGEECLAHLAATEVDALVLDLGLPGISGHEVCRRLKASPAWRELPIVVLTARDGHEDMVDALAAGADDYVVKSGNLTGLLARLRAQLRRRDYERRNRRLRMELLHNELQLERNRLRDERAKQELTQQLYQSQKMESVGRLAGGIAHDFNNLLTVISGFAEVVYHGIEEGSPLREDLREVLKAASRAANLVRQLLAFSRKQALQPRVFDLSATVRDAGKMLRRLVPATSSIEVNAGEAPATVFADPTQVDQVLFNLVVNASDAMPRGGRITLEVRRGLAAAELPRSVRLAQGTYHLITVRDTGMGMTDETIRRAFEPFYTTKEVGRGTGLGLSTVYGIVTQSGGDVAIESQLGLGTAIHVALPATDRVPEQPSSAGIAVPEAPPGVVLVVDNEPALRAMTCRFLTSAGFRVIEASGGLNAVELIEQGQSFDAMVADVMMPDLGGPQVAEALQKRRPGVPVLFVSGYADQDLIARYPSLKGARFLTKPYARDALVNAVRDLLAGRAQGAR